MVKFSLLSALVSCAWLVAAQDTSLADVKAAVDTAKIPTVLKITFNPTVLFTVTYTDSARKQVPLKAGTQLPKAATTNQPAFGIASPLPDGVKGPFVVIFVDLDAMTPANPSFSPIRHYLGGDWNIAANATAPPFTLSTSTAAASRYFSPAPQAGGGAHRYCFFLYAQSSKFKSTSLSSSFTNWDMANYTKAAGLGDPLGGTFMMLSAEV